MARIGVLAAVAAVLAAALVPAQEPAPPGAVIVRLQARAQVADSVVLLADVAQVEGGEGTLARRAAALDVADLAGAEVAVSREQVAMRLQLAGIEPRQFRLEGVARAVVGPAPVDLSDASVLEACRRALRRALPGEADEVSVRLAQPVALPRLDLASGAVLRLEAGLLGAPKVPGRVTAEVGVLVNGARRAAVPVELDVRAWREQAVPRRRIEAGEALTAENVQAQRRATDPTVEYLSPAQALAGVRARRPLTPGQPVLAGDVETAKEARPVVVKARDLVRLVAHVGELRLTASGEALQDGQAGQVIRVRNVDSKNVVQGRVLDQATVEVDY